MCVWGGGGGGGGWGVVFVRKLERAVGGSFLSLIYSWFHKAIF